MNVNTKLNNVNSPYSREKRISHLEPVVSLILADLLAKSHGSRIDFCADELLKGLCTTRTLYNQRKMYKGNVKDRGFSVTLNHHCVGYSKSLDEDGDDIIVGDFLSTFSVGAGNPANYNTKTLILSLARYIAEISVDANIEYLTRNQRMDKTQLSKDIFRAICDARIFNNAPEVATTVQDKLFKEILPRISVLYDAVGRTKIKCNILTNSNTVGFTQGRRKVYIREYTLAPPPSFVGMVTRYISTTRDLNSMQRKLVASIIRTEWPAISFAHFRPKNITKCLITDLVVFAAQYVVQHSDFQGSVKNVQYYPLNYSAVYEINIEGLTDQEVEGLALAYSHSDQPPANENDNYNSPKGKKRIKKLKKAANSYALEGSCSSHQTLSSITLSGGNKLWGYSENSQSEAWVPPEDFILEEKEAERRQTVIERVREELNRQYDAGVLEKPLTRDEETAKQFTEAQAKIEKQKNAAQEAMEKMRKEWGL